MNSFTANHIELKVTNCSFSLDISMVRELFSGLFFQFPALFSSSSATSFLFRKTCFFSRERPVIFPKNCKRKKISLRSYVWIACLDRRQMHPASLYFTNFSRKRWREMRERERVDDLVWDSTPFLAFLSWSVPFSLKERKKINSGAQSWSLFSAIHVLYTW